jgi:shikimate kinase
VCLTATVDTVMARVAPHGTAKNRPLLAGGDVRERVAELLAERRAAYAAFDQVATDGLSPSQVCDAVLAVMAAE